MNDRPLTAGRLRAAVLVLLCAGLAPAQAPDARPPGGLWLSNVGLFANYYSRGTARDDLLSGGVALRGDGAFGGMATVNMARTRERSQISLEYTPTYSRRLRYHEWDTLNQSLLFHASRSIAPKLRFSFSASGMLMNAEDFLFNPLRLSALATRPGTAADLADLVGNRSTSPGTAGAILAGSPEDDAATGYLLFGRRMLTSHAHTDLTYSWTPRLSISFGFGVGRTQRMPSGRENEPVSAVGQITTGTGSIRLDYSLSPRTRIGVEGSSMKHRSGVHSALITSGRFNIERMLTQRWFVNAATGMGAFTDLRELAPPTRPGEFTGGGSLGYRNNSQTWLGSYDRRIGSSFGLATARGDSAGGSWHWFHPSSGTGISFGVNWHRLTGTFETETWRGIASVGKNLTRYTSLSVGLAYSYATYHLASGPVLRRQFAVRTQYSWSPRGAGIF